MRGVAAFGGGCPLGGGCAEETGAIDDAFGAGVEQGLAVGCGLEASADLAGQALADHLDEGAVVALAHGGVEVDELDERVGREAVDPVLEVVEGELEGFALDELDDTAAHEVDGRDEHYLFSQAFGS